MKHPLADLRRQSRGFTLVEVMLALGVAALGIIAILGLLPNALQSSRDAADNTLAATIAQDLFGSIRTQPFHSVDIGDGGGAHDLAVQIPPNSPLRLNYDYAGYSTNAAGAYYRALVSYQPQAGLNFTYVRAAVIWPANSASSVTNFL